jgi:hypothetical protein
MTSVPEMMEPQPNLPNRPCVIATNDAADIIQLQHPDAKGVIIVKLPGDKQAGVCVYGYTDDELKLALLHMLECVQRMASALDLTFTIVAE